MLRMAGSTVKSCLPGSVILNSFMMKSSVTGWVGLRDASDAERSASVSGSLASIAHVRKTAYCGDTPRVTMSGGGTGVGGTGVAPLPVLPVS